MIDDELREHLAGLIERRNRFAQQLDGLLDRADRLEQKMKKIDAEIREYM